MPQEEPWEDKIVVSKEQFFQRNLSHIGKIQECFWVYIPKLMYGLVHDLRKGEASRTQETCLKPDFNAIFQVRKLLGYISGCYKERYDIFSKAKDRD